MSLQKFPSSQSTSLAHSIHFPPKSKLSIKASPSSPKTYFPKSWLLKLYSLYEQSQIKETHSHFTLYPTLLLEAQFSYFFLKLPQLPLKLLASTWWTTIGGLFGSFKGGENHFYWEPNHPLLLQEGSSSTQFKVSSISIENESFFLQLLSSFLSCKHVIVAQLLCLMQEECKQPCLLPSMVETIGTPFQAQS